VDVNFPRNYWMALGMKTMKRKGKRRAIQRKQNYNLLSLPHPPNNN
jgi:hypothetical protein